MHHMRWIRIDLISCRNRMNGVENSCGRRVTVRISISIHDLFQMMCYFLLIEEYALETSEIILVDRHIGYGCLEK